MKTTTALAKNHMAAYQAEQVNKNIKCNKQIWEILQAMAVIHTTSPTQMLQALVIKVADEDHGWKIKLPDDEPV